MLNEPLGLVRIGEESRLSPIMHKSMTGDILTTGVSKIVVKESPLSRYVYSLVRSLPNYADIDLYTPVELQIKVTESEDKLKAYMAIERPTVAAF